MSSTFLLGVLLLVCFTADAHAEKVLDVLKGSTVVLSPDVVETSIISVTWKHGDDLAAEWFGGNVIFNHSFKDRCSLNTKTGELTINNTRLEDSGEYTPEINNQNLTAIKLQVLSPVPKPSISLSCNSEQTKCTLTCTFDRTDHLGNVEVFWIHDDSREKGEREIPITQETNEETFICSLNNSVSSESSLELQNPFLAERRLFTAVILSMFFTAFCALCFMMFLFYCLMKEELIPQDVDEMVERFFKESKDMKFVKGCKRKLLSVVQTIEKFFKRRTEIRLSEESDLMLLIVRSVILRTLKKNKDVEKSLQNVLLMIKRFFKERNQTKAKDECEVRLLKVHKMILKTILERKKNTVVEDSPDGNISTSEMSEHMLLPECINL